MKIFIAILSKPTSELALLKFCNIKQKFVLTYIVQDMLELLVSLFQLIRSFISTNRMIHVQIKIC